VNERTRSHVNALVDAQFVQVFNANVIVNGASWRQRRLTHGCFDWHCQNDMIFLYVGR
jgi:hypothetical protein